MCFKKEFKKLVSVFNYSFEPNRHNSFASRPEFLKTAKMELSTENYLRIKEVFFNWDSDITSSKNKLRNFLTSISLQDKELFCKVIIVHEERTSSEAEKLNKEELDEEELNKKINDFRNNNPAATSYSPLSGAYDVLREINNNPPRELINSKNNLTVAYN
jgi:hypothetical protein